MIKRAFEANRVDQLMVGDWGDVQAALGLLSDDEMKQLQAQRARAFEFPFASFVGEETADTEHRQHGTASQRKIKKQMAKQSRKKNRRR